MEDEKALRVSVAKFLRKNGFSVAEASDGSAAIELFRTGGANIDLVLLDLTIPGTSSRDVIAEVRRMEPHTRLILTSAYELEKALAPSDTPQFATFIRKPFQLSDLLKLLQDCLSAKSSTSG